MYKAYDNNAVFNRNFEFQQMMLMEAEQLRQKSWQERVGEEERPQQKKRSFLRRNGR